MNWTPASAGVTGVWCMRNADLPPLGHTGEGRYPGPESRPRLKVPNAPLAELNSRPVPRILPLTKTGEAPNGYGHGGGPPYLYRRRARHGHFGHFAHEHSWHGLRRLSPDINPAYAGGHEGADLWTWAINNVLTDGKMRALFTMLFGASTVLIASRAEVGSGLGPAQTHYRRLFWMFVIGMVHAYFLVVRRYPGDLHPGRDLHLPLP